MRKNILVYTTEPVSEDRLTRLRRQYRCSAYVVKDISLLKTDYVVESLQSFTARFDCIRKGLPTEDRFDMLLNSIDLNDVVGQVSNLSTLETHPGIFVVSAELSLRDQPNIPEKGVLVIRGRKTMIPDLLHSAVSVLEGITCLQYDYSGMIIDREIS